MVITLDIQKKAAPIINQANIVRRTLELDAIEHLIESLTDLILIIEGFDNHIAALSKNEIKTIEDNTIKVIFGFVELDEELERIGYFNNPNFKENFRYALKTLYKLKSLLHIAFTKDIQVKKTPMQIRESLSAIARASVLNNLFKYTH